MGKGCKTDKELDILDRLKHENRKLKRELKAVRKMLDRYDVAEQSGLIDENAIMPSKKRRKEAELRKLWKCYKCQKGVLKIIRIGNRYFRKCTYCDKHTKSQIWDDSVEGIE